MPRAEHEEDRKEKDDDDAEHRVASAALDERADTQHGARC